LPHTLRATRRTRFLLVASTLLAWSSVADAQRPQPWMLSSVVENGSVATLRRASHAPSNGWAFSTDGRTIRVLGQWTYSADCEAPSAIAHEVWADTVTVVILTGFPRRPGVDCWTTWSQSPYEVLVSGLELLTYHVIVRLVDIEAVWRPLRTGSPVASGKVSFP